MRISEPSGAASPIGAAADFAAPPSNRHLVWLAVALLAVYAIGLYGRNLWNPDEPREADIAWRMSWQAQLAVPTLAGEAFCEKPPLTYWAAAASIGLFGASPWAMRLPNLLYALVMAGALAALTRRWLGGRAAVVAAVASATLLLCYQTAIWLATDAPLMAATAIALYGLSLGFYARDGAERWRGYLSMHAALAAGFLCKSVAGWLVPVLCLVTLAVWEKRGRELLRRELWCGILLQIAIIAPWIWFVYVGPHGLENLKVFFWNNLVGRFTAIDAPAPLQYTSAHRNSPGKYFLELPLYLWPWTLLVIAALRCAWRERAGAMGGGAPCSAREEFDSAASGATQRHARDERDSAASGAAVCRIGLCAFLPALAVLSLAATARNIYLAPAVLGLALLLAWWADRCAQRLDRFDVAILRATSGLLVLAAVLAIPVVAAIGLDAAAAHALSLAFIPVSGLGILIAMILAGHAWRTAPARPIYVTLTASALAYCALLIGPVSQAYARINAWQDLSGIGAAIGRDSLNAPLILYLPDETTVAAVDLYARRPFSTLMAPTETAAIAALRAKLALEPGSQALVMLPGRALTPALAALAARVGNAKFMKSPESLPGWIRGADFKIVARYEIPNGRRYALIAAAAR